MNLKTTLLPLLATALMTVLPHAATPAAEPFACRLDGLTPEQRTRHRGVTRALLDAVQEKKEIANGFALQFPAASLMVAAEWVSFERLCCPFLDFELEQQRGQVPVWLRVTGAEGVKDFLRLELGL